MAHAGNGAGNFRVRPYRRLLEMFLLMLVAKACAIVDGLQSLLTDRERDMHQLKMQNTKTNPVVRLSVPITARSARNWRQTIGRQVVRRLATTRVRAAFERNEPRTRLVPAVAVQRFYIGAIDMQTRRRHIA